MMSAKGKIISFVLLIALMVIPLTGCPGNLPPIADFLYSPLSPTTSDTISFTDNSTDDGFIDSWYWDFGDGNTSTLEDPTHSFASAGTYTVTLTVTDDDGVSDSDTATITVTSLPQIGPWDAIEILVKEIIPPASAYERISAFMLSEPLQNGDVVTSANGGNYPITANTWFIFIDDAPEALFAHNTRYVFMDAVTADYDIVNENWPPEINGFSMWDTQNVGRGHLIELWSILDNPAPIAGGISDAPEGDYGDAPDEELEPYYGITGHFPTLFNTTNSQFGRPGGHTLNVGEETLGLNVSAEVDAIDPNDPDGAPNLVDADSDERMYAIMEGTQARLAFTVTVSPNAPDVTRYANALIDFDQSGNWSTGNFGIEWVVVNLEVDVDPGDSETILTPAFSWSNQLVPPSEVWMRVALTRTEVDEALFANVGGWDGSGQYAYGEIEDKFVFLTDMPPPPDGEDGEPPPSPPPPGPPTGPCGYEINYYALIINCGDHHKHIGEGKPIVQASATNMASLINSQGYTLIRNLGPGNTGVSQLSLANIADAFDELALFVNCGDHVLIYIIGHSGKKTGDFPNGGIVLHDSRGVKTGEALTPAYLASLLAKIPACPDEDCDTPFECCHVSVVIETCHAGEFDVPGVTGPGRSITGTSSDEYAWATYPGGGVYTQGLDRDLRDPASDTNGDGGVDPVEAHASAEAAVNDNNQRYGKDQDPWNDNQWCVCKCPCAASIDVEKWVWYDPSGWVDEIEVPLDQRVLFRLEIENDGVCRDIIEIVVTDFLPDCLLFDDEAVIYFDGVLFGARPPDEINYVVGGVELVWYLEEVLYLAPGESIVIEYYAYAADFGLNINEVFASAHCSYNYEVVVTDSDIASVWVQEELPPAETVLSAGFTYHAECIWDELGCRCTVTIEFWAEDISTGDVYPVTNVVLYIDGVPYDSGTISTDYYYNYVVIEAGCGQTIHIEIVAMNLVGLTVTFDEFFTTPIP